MKGIYALATIIFLSLVTACQPKLDRTEFCKKWQNGKFLYEQDGLRYLIERSEGLQTETDLATNDFTKFIVKWMDNCTYRLHFYQGPKYLQQVWNDEYMEVTILNETEDSYTYRATFSATDTEDIKTVTRYTDR